MAVRIVRTEADCTPEQAVRRIPVPFEDVLDLRQSGVRLGEGRVEEALAVAEVALALDPMSPSMEAGIAGWFGFSASTLRNRSAASSNRRILYSRLLTRPLGGVLRALRLSPLVDAVDKVLAKYRKRLGRFVPEGPARRYP